MEALFLQKQGKKISDPQDTMNTIIINWEVEEANEEKESGTVQDNSDLKQALQQRQDYLAFIKQQQEDASKSDKQLAKE